MPSIHRAPFLLTLLLFPVLAGAPEAASAKGIRSHNFRNYSYPSKICGFSKNRKVSVTKGRFKGKRGFLLTVDQVTYGDSNGDGKEEALVLLTCATKAGTTGTGRLYEWGRSAKDKKKGKPPGPRLLATFTGAGRLESAEFTQGGVKAVREGGGAERWAWGATGLALQQGAPAPSPPKPPASGSPAVAPPSHALVSWSAWNGSLPQGAAVGGQEPGRSLPICRAVHEGGTHPGKLVAGRCNFGYGGREIVASRFEVLVDQGRGRWVAAPGGGLPADALVGGREAQRDLVVCRAPHEGGVHPGKVVGRRCNIGWGGKEFGLPNFEVLVVGPHWVAGAGPLPAEAAIGGNEPGRTLPICRSSHEGGLHPGKLVAGRCNFGYGGKEIVASSYQVLVDHGLSSWLTARGGTVPADAFIGGREPGRALPICRASYQGGMHPGKVVAGRCNIGWGGQEVTVDGFQVLVMKRP